MVCRKFLMGPSKNLVSSWRGYVNISIVFSPKHQFMTPLLYIYIRIYFLYSWGWAIVHTSGVFIALLYIDNGNASVLVLAATNVEANYAASACGRSLGENIGWQLRSASETLGKPPMHALPWRPQPWRPQPWRPQPWRPQPWRPQPWRQRRRQWRRLWL
eukprot:SAG25_NODE_723_length_5722_cov_7.544905_3_plen_159_part_00